VSLSLPRDPKLAADSRFERVLVGVVAICTSLALTNAAVARPPTPLPNPDPVASTPVLRSAGATASASQRCRRMRERLVQGASHTGLFVADARSGVVLCRKSSRTRRPLASNMKLFTTATALARFGEDERIATRVFGLGRPDTRGTLRGGLYLKGGGDPALGSPAFYDTFLGGLGTNLFALARQLRIEGIRRVSGRLFADDTVFDRRRGVADSGYATSPYIGPLSGLAFNSGYSDSSGRRFARDPAKVAATKLARSLRNRGVAIRTRVARRETPPRARLLAVVRSPRIATLANATNVYSNNYFAEMLLKNVGAHFGAGGSTGAGATVVERFARAHGSAVHAVDGSGLTRSNRASPAEVGRLLQTMRNHQAGGAFVRSLAVAGREGTVAERMRGTAAAGRCRTKTGTLIGVSALSGYCFNRSGRVIVFSTLMSGVGNLHRAHLAQDRIAALAAGY
jgi:D-alanyl-D-alanine carboxypeptidase/D-alanyl-D-alanine-endopeptidase (penicillin-binding protein 4)